MPIDEKSDTWWSGDPQREQVLRFVLPLRLDRLCVADPAASCSRVCAAPPLLPSPSDAATAGRLPVGIPDRLAPPGAAPLPLAPLLVSPAVCCSFAGPAPSAAPLPPAVAAIWFFFAAFAASASFLACAAWPKKP